MQVGYVDVDTLWVDDAINWWQEFEKMGNLSKSFGMAEEASKVVGGSWYSNGALLLSPSEPHGFLIRTCCMMPVSVMKGLGVCAYAIHA